MTNDKTSVEEPVAGAFSESFNASGLLSKVMRLSRSDKDALLRYLKEETTDDEPFATDECGRIVLTHDMKEAVRRAELELQNGTCLTEDTFQRRFARWL